MQSKLILAGTAALALMAAASQAGAVTIASGNGAFSVGIGDNGELFDSAAGLGFQRVADGFDPIQPGTPRDSWGLSAGGFNAYADGANFGTLGISSTSIVAGANSAVATTLTDFGFSVVQAYSFVGAGNVLKIDTLVTNNTAGSLLGIFQRNVDWDIAPTAFGENVLGTIGAGSGLIDSSYFGFEDPTASAPYAASCLTGCNSTGDLGAGLKINLGLLGAGGSRAFTYYYGVNLAGDSVDALIAQGQAAGAEFLVAGQSSEGFDFPGYGANSAILGVSGGVPEPATWAMLLMGFAGLGGALRRRRAALA